jgi:hypothetical protein
MLSCICAEMTTYTSFKCLSHAENLRHVTDEFSSSPKEGWSGDEIFAFKYPTGSAGYEYANFGTEGQPANPRPPKPKNYPYNIGNTTGYF